MNKEDLILLAVVAISVYGIARMVVKKPADKGPVNTYEATEIMRSDGWTYYTDGTSIDPNGRYYQGSTLVYDPKGMYQ